MRTEKTVNIQIDEKTTKEYKVFEIRPLDLFEIWNAEGTESAAFLESLDKTLPLLTTATLEELKGMFPSALEKLYFAFKEVNSPLFRTAPALDLGKIIEKLKSSLIKDLQNIVAGSLEPDTKT